MWGAHCKTLSMTILSLIAFRKRLLQITSRSANLRLRLLVNQHHVVTAVVIAYHRRFRRKRNKRVSSCFVGIVKSYCSRSNTVVYARKFGTTLMVEIGFAVMNARFGFTLNVI
uniref:Secreted protein n=1 Tax=Arundo donax TaxID=35708 RepID=A0A0A9DQ72_ARUDO